MKGVLLLALVVLLAACEGSGNVKTGLDSAKQKVDTLVNKVENSAVVDSIKSKGGQILDSVKSKGGRLIEKADEKINGVKKQDTAH